MMPNELSALWTTLGPALANHLWQSTLFVLAAALLTVALRKNQARTRYWIWLAASVKFLIPFAPLIVLGEQLGWLRSSGEAQPGVYFTIEQIGQPFTSPTVGGIRAAASPIHLSAASALLPTVLILLWLGGFAAVVAIWCVRWRRISAVIRQSTPVLDGIEMEILRRLESTLEIPTQLKILSSPTTLEPGIFGIARPVLLWPEGISARFTPEHLEAVLAHELCHIRRRDNLAGAIQMLVEALFWFHPLVWWMGSRLIDERERACDEQVLEFGSRREVYAESILKVCEFCIGSPLACVAGVTGSDLKKRMVHIMSEHIGRKLDFSRKLLLTTAAVLAIAIPVMVGVFNATPSRAQSTDAATTPTFQSFSIKPSDSSTPGPNIEIGNPRPLRMMYGPEGFVADNVTLQALIQEAYGVEPNQISGPADLLSGTYNVVAKADPSTGAKFGPGFGNGAGQLALQAALAEHVKLVVHHETKELPVYALVVAEGGPKLQPTPSSQLAGDQRKIGMQMLLKGRGQDSIVTAQGVSINDLVRQLSMQLGLAVIDKTGLKGAYSFNLHWAQNLNQPDAEAADNSSTTPKASLIAAVQQQLGLKLELQKQPMDVIVIDHLEEPMGN